MSDLYTMIVTSISTVGFPIVICLLMFWFCKYQLDMIKTTIEENTKAVTELVKVLECANIGRKD